MRTGFSIAIAFTVGFLCPLPDCAQTKKPCDLERFASNATVLYEAASASSISAKSGTDVVVFCDEEEYAFDAEGRSVHSTYIVYKVLTQKGKDDWDGVSEQWEPWHEQKPEFRARVIAAGNISNWLDQNSIADSPAGDNDEKIYSDRREAKAPLPAVGIGSVVERETIVKEMSPLFAAGTIHFSSMGRYVPVVESRLLVQSTSSLPIQYKTELLPDIKIEKNEANGTIQYIFTQEAMEALEDSENYLPSDIPAFPKIIFSTGKSWQEVARTYSDIVDKRIAAAGLQTTIATITKGHSTREEKLSAILEYLSKEIRYTGVEFDEASMAPHSPAETLKRKYGDCKDKSTLLVALLRTAGIPAYVALLNAGDREDIPESLPGMGQFDHAIVYVPGTPQYWIDATDEYARLGQVPGPDQGRLALVASPDTDGLKRTFEASSRENRIVEKREFDLAESGPARIVEVTEPEGVYESNYRSYYADQENKDAKKSLTDYIKSEYLADKLEKTERSDPKNLSKPFRLSIETGKGKRGSTDLDSAVVAIRLDSLFSRLPDEFETKEDENEKKSQAEAEKPKKPRTADYQLPKMFLVEWQYTIKPPLGFQVKTLPAAKKLQLGPASLTEEFSLEKDGTVRGILVFDCAKRRFTSAEGKELREKVVQAKDAEPIFIYFEPVAQALLTQGKVKESLQASRDLISAHPKEALHHLQIARTLLAAGQGEAARNEARLATMLEPNSALAQKTAAEIFEYDLVGRKMRPGSDLSAAEAGYRKAEKLDPDDKSVKGDLAILLEYNDEGERYGIGAKLKEAVDEYKKLSGEELEGIGLKNNPPFAMFYGGEFAEARSYAEKLNPQLNALIVAVESLAKGAQAGIVEAHKRTTSEDDFKRVVKTAGDMVMRLRKFEIAADLEEAGAAGSNASNIMALASMLRKAKPRETLKYADDPASLAMKYFADLLDGRITNEIMEKTLSKNARIVTERQDKEEFKKLANVRRDVRISLQRSGLPVDAMIDAVLARMEPKTEGNDATGYRVTLRAMGVRPITNFIVKEDGHYKLLDSGERPNSIALEALDRVKAGDLPGARQLLDWVREEQSIAGGDDPLAGYAFPRMWTKGKEGDAEQIKLATAALLAETSETAKEGLEILEPASETVKDEAILVNIRTALLYGYSNQDNFAKMFQVASQLSQTYPESKRLFLDQEYALRGLGKFVEADRLAGERLKRDEADLDGLRAMQRNAVAAGKYDDARERGIQIEKIGKAEALDLNGIAWNALFTGKVGESDLEYTRKATQSSQNDASVLHTLGCVYAELGRTKEAREVLIQAMDLLHLYEPDGNYWYAFGRIAEQFGLNDVAAGDYKRVESPKKPWMIPGSSYQLAQIRLKAMNQ
ncbi:MAG: DUF3857 domain-containing protein [Acidobacteria bacterium]|nr:DUF3857 domain-containing protein [Acidobacteriota bacterium]MBS1866033.1 DUF3857 domain-containing protein [Acidobacteriota bacterium]